jgi:uncharacterized protein (TIGR03083 family)
MTTAPDWLDLLRTRTSRFADVLRGADPDAPVTFCPGWAVRDLAVHLGGVHQWAAHAVVAGHPDFRPQQPAHDQPGLADWYAESAAGLVDVLTTTPADAPAWTLDERDRTAGSWRRRQVHETVLHTWDVEQAIGRPTPIEPWLAWDGVVEVEEVLYPRQLRLGRIEPLARAVRLVATDVPGDLVLGDGEPIVVRGRAELLLRLLWHRVDAHDEGIAPEAATVLAAAVTP